MPPVAAIAGSVLSGPVGGIVSSIAGNVAGSVLGGAGGPGGPLGGVVGNLLGGIQDAFSNLFGPKRHQHTHHHHHCHPHPPCCHFPGTLPFNPIGDIKNIFNQIMQQLDKLLGKAPVGGQQPGGTTQIGLHDEKGKATGEKVSYEKGDIDGMMAAAEKLLGSESMKDQAAGQKLMAKATNMFQLLSKLYEQQASMQKTAIQNIR